MCIMYTLCAELNELRREKQELEESCQVLEQQLREAEHMSRRELSRQLQARRHRQAELERQIQNLEQQRRRLSSTKNEVQSCCGHAGCCEVTYQHVHLYRFDDSIRQTRYAKCMYNAL